jgi:hypothetical protein
MQDHPSPWKVITFWVGHPVSVKAGFKDPWLPGCPKCLKKYFLYNSLNKMAFISQTHLFIIILNILIIKRCVWLIKTILLSLVNTPGW